MYRVSWLLVYNLIVVVDHIQVFSVHGQISSGGGDAHDSLFSGKKPLMLPTGFVCS
jgi:hypothetical protein